MPTVLITGSNRGLGLELAKSFVTTDYHIVMTARSLDKLDSVNLPPQSVTKMELDIADYDSIDNFVKEFTNKFTSLDMLIHNAAIIDTIDRTGDIPAIDGKIMEETFRTNFFGPAELTRQLLSTLSDDCIIVNIGARPSIFKYLGRSHMYPMYRLSKLALHGWSTIMTKYFEETSKKTINIHPGWIKTGMGGDEAPYEPADVAQKIVELLQGDIAKYNGKIVVDWKIEEW